MGKPFSQRIIFCYFLCIVSYGLFAQNGFRSGTLDQGWGIGWTNTEYWTSTGFGTTFGKTYQNTLGNGHRYFRLYTDWSGQTREHGPNGSSDIQVAVGATTNLETVGQGKAYYINVSNTSNNYVFRTRHGDGINNAAQLTVFEIQGNVRSVSLVSQSPTATAVTNTSAVMVTSYLNGNLATGQGVYVRYTTDNWASSVITPMSGSGITYSASIPAQSSGTNVKYYIFTSGAGLNISHADADFYTINGNTNNGANYQYTVLAGSSTVTLTPTYPNDQQNIMITFDASGTALAGATEVYLHAGVSVMEGNPTAFQYSIGNWGQNDGVGEMTFISNNIWSISLTSLRSYFDVPLENDIFGLNLLFRNGNGTLKEDLGGANYYFPVDPGSYMTITFPVNNLHFVTIGQVVPHTSVANVAPTTWILKEIDPLTNLDITTLHTQVGGATFNYNIAITTTAIRKFKLMADFGGTVKAKNFSLQGYNPVGESPRPSWTKPGINYHAGDPTKATLVLHAPTYTRYLKGNGTVSGTNATMPKNVVYVMGDFNNWTASEAYKMYRDRDGWDGTSDADNDNDHGDYWWIELSGLIPGQEYVFQYLIDGALQVADPYTRKVSDPDDWQISNAIYPNLIPYRPQANDRASVLQTNQSSYPWVALPFAKPTDNNLHIYELHFRDFTEEGTYLAAIEKLDYINGLGINAIHVMPVSEFEGNSSWGYNPNFYFAADKAYGTADDLKKFIDECHKRKIQVFNDLVLNHAFYSNVMAKMYWNSAANKPANDNPWFNPDHKMVADPAGWWGADWNHESEHTQVMVDKILDYWLQEFRFDGFRFDFTKGFGQTAQDPSDPWASSYDQDRIDLLLRMVNGMKSRNPGSVVIFEHLAWATEDKILADQGILMWSGVGHHNDMKGFILGYNGDNTNIYNSGIYNATGRDFMYANWMSYGESHDEERLGYEVSQYFNGAKTLENIVKRLKIALGFNLLFPGPRMIWQFQELGYDVSINFNGRTGEKPVRWYYYDDSHRRQLFNLTSRLFKIRNKFNIFNTTPDYGNIGLGAGNISQPRVMRLSSANGVNGKHVIVMANLDPVNNQTAYPTYDVTGTWYKYNGDSAVDGTAISVNNVNSPYTLSPSEMLVLTNFLIDTCTDVRSTADNGLNTLRDAIDCAPENGVVNMEFPVHNQNITLISPITINKSITINGFPSQNVTINGAGTSQSVFSIAPNKSVTLNGLKMTCSHANVNGRCIVNEGILTLDNITLTDINGSISGSTVWNMLSGTISIERSVDIIR